jgi:aryl-alcohol dehydrogenase-like predicted oxidoreductase
LGHSGIEVAPFAFGGNVLGGTADEATSKVGISMGPSRKRLSKQYIIEAVEASLRRLNTDYIDLYQSHVDDADTPLEETLEAYAQLIRQGKVRAIGASNHTAARLEESLRVSATAGLPSYQSLPPQYNLYDRAGFERDVQGICVKHGLGVLTYFSLANGFLTGKYRTYADLGSSARSAAVKPYLNLRGMAILAALDEVGQRLRVTPAQIALAWLSTRPAVTAPIASATSLAQLDDLMAAAHLSLPAEAIATLDAASA